MSDSVAQILSAVTISDVARAHGYEPKRGRIPAPWRETHDRNVGLSDAKGTWYDYVTGEGGGLLDFLSRIRGGTRADAVRWLAQYAGVLLDDVHLSPAQRRAWAKQQRAIERDLPAARMWIRALVILVQAELDLRKAALFERTGERPRIGEIHSLTRLLGHLERLEGTALIQEYRRHREHYPHIVGPLVAWVQLREAAERAAIERYIREMA